MTRRHTQNGFTLIEAITAIVILSLAVPPMMWAIRSAHVQRVNPMMASRARWLATEKLEDVIADRHSESRGYDYLNSSNYPDESPVSGFPGFSRRVVFNETGADLSSPGNGYMTVTVEVSWADASQQQQTLTVSTVVTEYDT